MNKIIFLYVFFVNLTFCSFFKKNINQKINDISICIRANNNFLKSFNISLYNDTLKDFKKLLLAQFNLNLFLVTNGYLINALYLKLQNTDLFYITHLDNKFTQANFEKNKIIENKKNDLVNIFNLNHQNLLIYIYTQLKKKDIYCVEDLKKISLLVFDFLIKNQMIYFIDDGSMVFFCIFFLADHIFNIRELYNLCKEDKKTYYSFYLILSLFFLKTAYNVYTAEELLKSAKSKTNNTKYCFLENFFPFYQSFYFEENFLLNFEEDNFLIEKCIDVFFQLQEKIMKLREELKKDIDSKEETRFFINIILTEKIIFYFAVMRSLFFNNKNKLLLNNKNMMLRNSVKSYDPSVLSKSKFLLSFDFINNVLFKPNQFKIYRKNLFFIYNQYRYSYLIKSENYINEEEFFNKKLKKVLVF